MKRRTPIGWLLLLIGLMALPAWAVEYRLQVANLDYLVFSSYQENPPREPALWLIRVGSRVDHHPGMFHMMGVIPVYLPIAQMRKGLGLFYGTES